MTYQETIDAFNEAISLGYSPKEVLQELEQCEEAHPKAVDEIRSLVKYGV